MAHQDKWLTKVAFLGISFLLTSAYAINSALPQIKDNLGISQFESQVLSIAPAIAVMIFVLISPLISQRLGDKRTIIVGVLIVGFSGIVPAFVSSYAIILLSRIVLGAGFGLFNSLAVSMISVMYQGQTRSSMLGMRAASEQIGQAVLTVVASTLLGFGWHQVFLLYLVAFPILYLFCKRVPDTSQAVDESDRADLAAAQTKARAMVSDNEPQRVSPLVAVLTAFAAFLVIDFMLVQLNYPYIVAQLKGNDFSTSPMIAAMLFFAMLGGMTYGWFQKMFGRFTLQIGLVVMAIANALVALADGNFYVLTIGFVLIGFPLQLVAPFIFNQLPALAPKKWQSMITSIVIVGFNLGAVLEPVLLKAMASLLSLTDNQVAGRLVVYFGGILLAIALLTLVFVKKQNPTRITE